MLRVGGSLMISDLLFARVRLSNGYVLPVLTFSLIPCLRLTMR